MLNNNMKKLIYIILILLLASPAFGATYYVDKTTGSDSDSGLTEALAWETIAKVNDFAEATGFASGDIIQFKRGETWEESEGIGWDGAAINWDGGGAIVGLTIQDYGSGNLPLISGNTERPIYIVESGISNLTIKNLDLSGMDWSSSTFEGQVTVFYVDGLVIDGVYIDGHIGASSYSHHEAGVKINGVAGAIEVKNCTVLNMYKDTFANSVTDWGVGDYSGIFLYFDSGGKTTGTISIHDNTVSNVYSDAIATEGTLVGAEVYNNTISSFGENAVETKGSRYVNVYNNDISWNDFGSNPGEAYWGATVFVGAPSSITNNVSVGYHTFHDNYVHDCALACIRSASTLGLDVYNNYFEDVGMAFVATSGKTNQRFYNNLVVQTVASGSSTAMDSAVYKSGATVSSTSTTNKIINNTFYVSNSNNGYGIYLYDGAGATVRNNIVQMTRAAAVFPIYSAGTGPTISYNTFYNANHTNRAYENGTTYDSTDQAAWISAGHTSGLFGNPEFTTPGTVFTLDNADNINVDSGTNAGADYDEGWNPTASMPPVTVTTIDQDMRGSGWERGAYVYDDDPPTGDPIEITYDAGGAITITPDAGGALTITY